MSFTRCTTLFFALFALLMLPAGNAQAGTTDELAKAEQLHKQAIALQGGWVSTEKYIKESKAALKAGKTDKAKQAADKALRHARRSLAQAEEQRRQWQEPDYLRNP